MHGCDGGNVQNPRPGRRSKPAALDVKIAKKEGAIDDSHILGEIGDILLGKVQGRESEEEITLFKSLGIAVKDLVAAHYIYEKALKAGTGVEVDIGGPTA